MWDIFVVEAVRGGVSSEIARLEAWTCPTGMSRINIFSFVKHVLWIIALLHSKQPECS